MRRIHLLGKLWLLRTLQRASHSLRSMKLSLFARGSGLDERSLARLAARGWRGVDVGLEALIAGRDPNATCVASGRTHMERLRTHGLQAVVRLSTRPPSGSSAPAEHVERLERGLAAVSALSDGDLTTSIAHIAVHVQCQRWRLDDAAAYLAGALPIAATYNEQNPHVGASARETDVFGGRPAHLIGVSTATERTFWGTGTSASTCV